MKINKASQFKERDALKPTKCVDFNYANFVGISLVVSHLIILKFYQN